jgi:ABC-2 family transporter protein
MTLLPIVERELRVAARRPVTFWMRSLVVLMAIVISSFVYMATYKASSRYFGHYLFTVLSGLSFLYCLGAGVRSTSDCLSEEKREGTLGLLFLTDLKGYDVVIGKIAATSLRGFYGLLAILPILALPIMVGGVAMAEFSRMALVLVNTFLFSLAVGIFVSALSKNARKAVVVTCALLVIFTIIIPLSCVIVLAMTPGHQSKVAEALLVPCPATAFMFAFDFNYLKSMKFFWYSTGTIHVFMWAFLAGASFILPRTWQDKPKGEAAAQWREIIHRWLYGSEARRRSFRTRLLDVNAFYWLASRMWFKPTQVWLLFSAIGCVWIWGSVEFGSVWFSEAIYFPTAMALNAILKLWVAAEAGHKLGQDRKLGALELILSTPMTVKDILRGQFLALRRQFFWPAAFVIGMQVIFMAASLQKESFHENRMNPVIWAAAIVMLVVDMTAVSWVAISLAMSSRNPNRTSGTTVVRMLVAPWILYIAIVILLSVMDEFFGWSLRPKWPFFIGLWFGLGMFADLVFGLMAWWTVNRRFRELALQRFAPKRVWWSRWLNRGEAKDVPPVVVG